MICYKPGPTWRFFQYKAGSGRVLKKSREADRFKSGRSVVIFVQVFPGTLFTLGYFRVCQVYTRCSGLPEMWVTRYPMIFKTVLVLLSMKERHFFSDQLVLEKFFVGKLRFGKTFPKL